MAAFIQTAVGSIISIALYALIIACVYKVFQMATDLTEIKDLLRDIKRNTRDPHAIDPQSPEDLLKALSAASYPPHIETEAAPDAR